MICTFIGHRDAPFSIKDELEKAVSLLISQGVKRFWIGNNGRFDYLVQAVLLDMLKTNPDIEIRIVLSKIDELSLIGKAELTVFPEELSGVPRKFAISKRNEYLMKRSSFVIAYVTSSITNSCKFVCKAKKRGIKVINLGELSLK